MLESWHNQQKEIVCILNEMQKEREGELAKWSGGGEGMEIACRAKPVCWFCVQAVALNELSC